MNARDTILARIREALRTPAPPPHVQSQQAQDVALTGSDESPGLTILPIDVAKPWLPDGGNSSHEQLQILTDNLTKLKAEVIRVTDMSTAIDEVKKLVQQNKWEQIGYHNHPLVSPLIDHFPDSTYLVDGHSFDKRQLERCDVGISSCESLISQTGSILISSKTCGGRGLSILPHAHIVMARVSQIVPTISDALRLAKNNNSNHMPSMLSFITGPSRTGDIERILVLGAHGPKELFVVLID